MTARMLPCQANRPDGTICSAMAVVQEVNHSYGTRMSWEVGGQFEQFLIETRYTFECPHCGARIKVEPAK